MFDIYVNDHNRYLKGIFAQIRNGELNEDLIRSLCIELNFAHVTSIKNRGAPLFLEKNNRKYMILYSSFNEFQKHFPDFEHSNTSFKWYLEALNAPVYFYNDSTGSIKETHDLESADGMIFDMEGEEFILEGELLEAVNDFFKIDLYSIDELEDIFENTDNSKLEKLFQKDPRDWDEVIREIGNSSLWVLLSLSKESTYVSYSGLFNIFQDNPFSYSDTVTLFTQNSIGNQYALTVSFKTAVDYVLSFGISGITIKTSDDDEVFLSRQLLVDKYDLIESYYDERLKRAYQCLFDLWR